MTMAEYHIFDMDYTLLENDCDVSWKEFCVAEGIAPESDIAEADRFYQLYLEGKLDFQEFVAFQLKEFSGKSIDEMARLAAGHFEKIVKPRIRPKALEYVRQLIADGKKCAILTSTNTVIAQPVGEFFGISQVIGASLELESGVYTGNITGIYTAGEGKAQIMREMSEKSGVPLSDFAAYGDSINDLPMLKAVGEPYAVSPGAALAAQAEDLGFTILDWSMNI
jgi:HAD superfamily hydrolase (TIGR01490 family)